MAQSRFEEISNILECPISSEIPENPIFLEGRFYEKELITQWVLKKGTVPHTNASTTENHLMNLSESECSAFQALKKSLEENSSILSDDFERYFEGMKARYRDYIASLPQIEEVDSIARTDDAVESGEFVEPIAAQILLDDLRTVPALDYDRFERAIPYKSIELTGAERRMVRHYIDNLNQKREALEAEIAESSQGIRRSLIDRVSQHLEQRNVVLQFCDRHSTQAECRLALETLFRIWMTIQYPEGSLRHQLITAFPHLVLSRESLHHWSQLRGRRPGGTPMIYLGQSYTIPKGIARIFELFATEMSDVELHAQLCVVCAEKCTPVHEQRVRFMSSMQQRIHSICRSSGMSAFYQALSATLHTVRRESIDEVSSDLGRERNELPRIFSRT